MKNLFYIAPLKIITWIIPPYDKSSFLSLGREIDNLKVKNNELKLKINNIYSNT